MADSKKTTSKLDFRPSEERMTGQSKALERVREKVTDTERYLTGNLAKLSRWVREGVDPRALIRFALLDLSAPGHAGDKLRECSPESIFMSLLACAVTGLEPGSLKGEAYLVPFGGKAQFMAGWKGLVKQARRSREVASVNPQVVFEGDTFELDLGSGLPPRHIVNTKAGQRGPIIGAYACAKLIGSRENIVSWEVEWMDMEDLNAVRAVSKTSNQADGPWGKWEDQMYRKAPIRRLAKRLPLGNDYYQGLAIEQAAADGRSERDVLDVMTGGEASQAQTAADKAGEMREQVSGDIDPDEAAEIARKERDER